MSRKSASIWAEVSVLVADEDAEQVAEVFREAGAGGVAFTGPSVLAEGAASNPLASFDLSGVETAGPTRVFAYFPVNDTLGEKVRLIEEGLAWVFAGRPDHKKPEVTLTRVEAQDWNRSWREHYKPERVGKRVVVVPTWTHYTPLPCDIVVLLDPGEAFGTGQHESTKGCVLALESRVCEGLSVLDVGTGSGILSIVAAKLGACRVVGIDVDPVAVETARANALANGVKERVTIEEGNLVEGISARFDVVVCNILPEVVRSLIPDLSRVLAPGGAFVSGGFTVQHEQGLTDALAREGHSPVDRIQIGDWVTLVSEARTCTSSS
ncbi:MAG: 50S ribosomal protein L11 methyltransferase [Firmicutes bacterium]|nr:50S ribosomal protein L11 methyltransferase [Bacillota bacterium]